MKKHLQKLLLLMTLLVVPWVTQGQSTLTVNDGTATNQYVPIYGYYVDMTSYEQTQFIIPQGQLVAMAGSSITELKFYANYSQDFGAANWNIYIGETSQTTMSSIVNLSDCELVYSGHLAISSNELDIPLNDEYAYGGGNLVVVFHKTASGTYSPSSSNKFYGVSATAGASGYRSSGSYSAQSFLPKLTFTYVADATTCKSVQSVSVANVERRSFDVTWTPKFGVTNCEGYEVVVSDTELDATALESATKHTVTDGSNTYHATGLTRNTPYYVYVRSNCGATDGVSEWVSATATTSGLTACADAVVANGTTTHTNTPLDFYNTDGSGLHKAQFLYPASLLSEQGVSGTIKGVTFYDKSGQTKTLSTTTWTVKVGATTATDLSSGFCSDDLTTVYSGNYVITSGVVDFTFDNDFEYEGGNLIVEISCTGANGNWYSSGGSGYYGVDGIGSTYSTRTNYTNFLPKTTFFCCVTNNPCPAVETVSYELTGEGTTTAMVSWTASTGDYANTYDVYYSTTEVTDFTGVTPQFTGVAVLSQALTGLSPYTDYYVYVMCHCDGEGQNDGISTWNGVHFKTNSACRVVTDLDVVPASKYTATATWTGTTQANNFQYVLSTTELTDAEVEAATPTAAGLTEATATLTGLVPGQTYYLYVANNCPGEGRSPYIGTSFVMPAACAEPANLEIANLGKYGFTVTWDADVYADATDTYDMIVSETELDADDLATATITYPAISGNSQDVNLLQRGTTYYVYVRGNCSVAENGTTDWVNISTTTLDIEPDCGNSIVANGTKTHASTPFDFYNTDGTGTLYKAQLLYPASLLAENGVSGTIKGVTFYDKSGATRNLTATAWTIKVGTTTATDLSAGFCPDELTTVYSGNYLISAGVVSFAFDNDFDYTGDNLVVEISCIGTGGNWYGSGGGTGYYGVDGIGSTYSSVSGYNNFVPKTTFAYCVPALLCPAVDAPVATDVTNTEATISWNAGTGDFATSYDLVISDTAVTDFEGVTLAADDVPETSFNAVDLAANTHYYTYVRVNCVNDIYDDGSSVWSPAGEFTTELPCLKPENFVAGSPLSDRVELSWIKRGTAVDWRIYVDTFDVEYTAGLPADTVFVNAADCQIVEDTVTYLLTGLQPVKAYTLALRSDCGEVDGLSKLALNTPSFTTLSNNTEIDTMTFISAEVLSCTIDRTAKTIDFVVRKGSDLEEMDGYIMPEHWTAQFRVNGEAFVTPWNLSAPVTVTVLAQDTNVTADWTITVTEEPCATPFNVAATDIERRTANLNWNIGDASTSFDFVVSETALEDPSTAELVQNITATNVDGACTYAVSGLTRGTHYYVYVRTNCGETYGQWRGTDFTTKALTDCGEVTVADGTNESGYIPVYGSYCDENQKTQSIYPVSMLTGLVGKQISKLKYEVTDGGSSAWSDAVFSIKMKVVEVSTLSGLLPVTDATVVYSGYLDASVAGGMEITLSTPFTYTGGNLLIAFEETTTSSYCTCKFKGIEASSASYLANVGYGVGAYNFLPKVEFSYCEEFEACPEVTNVAIDNIAETSATVTWTESTGDYANASDIYYSTTEVEDFTGVEPQLTGVYGNSAEITGLSQYTTYYVYVRTHCDAEGHDDGISPWSDGISFRTLSPCRVPGTPEATVTGKHTATVAWTNTSEGSQADNFTYILSATPIAEADLETAEATETAYSNTTVDVTNLISETTYHFYVKNVCTGEVNCSSPWDSCQFTMPVAMPAVINLHAYDIASNAFSAVWESDLANFADETAWEIACVPAGETPASWTTVYARDYFAIGLTPETSYDFYVRAKDGANYSANTMITVTTTAVPADCITLFDGTESSRNVPFYVYYYDNYSKANTIMPASSLQQLADKDITGMTFYIASGAAANSSLVEVYLKEVEDATVSTPIDVTTATKVYGPAAIDFTGTTVNITFTEPFHYNGGNLMIATQNTTIGGYNSVYFSGMNDAGSCGWAYNGSSLSSITSFSNTSTFVPKTTFCTAPEACKSVTNLIVDNITATSARAHWYPGADETEWQVINSTEQMTEDELAASTNYTTVTDNPFIMYFGLTKDKDYYFYVRGNCGDGETSRWKEAHYITLPSCSAPATAVATSEADNSITFTVTSGEYGTEGTYDYRYWIVGTTDTTTVAGQTSELTVNDLASSVYYAWEVRANCSGVDEGASRWVAGNDVHVCGVVTLPYSEGFETIPTTYSGPGMIETICWNDLNASANTSAYPYYYGSTSYVTEGNRSLQFRSSNVTPIYMIMPAIKDVTECQVNFDCAYENISSSGKFQVGYMTDPADATTFVPAFTDSPTSNYVMQSHTVNIFDIPEDARIAFCYTAGTMNNYYGWLDNVHVDTIPYFNVLASVNPETDPAIGSVEVACAATDTTATGKFYENTTPQFTAVPATGMFFVNWTNANNGDTLATVNPWTLTVNKDSSFVANFDTIAYDLVVTVNEATNFGTVSGSGTFKYLTSHQIEATPNEHYHFVAWNDDNADNPRTITMDTMDTAFVANFAIDTHQLTLTVMPLDVMGSVADVNGYYNYGDSVDISATANYGYFFTGWDDGETTNERRIAILNDTTIAAQFDSLSYTITAQTADAVMGAVTGTATQKYLTTATIEALPNYGYYFVAWNDGNTENPRTITVERDSLFTASFDSNSYDINVVSADIVMGAVTGTATQKYLTTATIEALPNYGYHFVAWNDGNTDNPRTFVVTCDSSFTATFDSIVYTVNILAELDEEGQPKGDVTGSGQYKYLSEVEITIDQHLGYYFVNWSDGDIRAVRTIKVTCDTTITAQFSEQPVWFVNTSCDAVMGSVTAPHNVLDSLMTTIEATANYGYHFTQWNDGVIDNPRTLQVVSDTAFTAEFDYNQYTIGVATADAVMGNVSAGGTFNYLTNVEMTATPNYGYHFVAWNDGNTDNPRTVQLTQDTAFTASFDSNTYVVTVVHDAVMGDVLNVGGHKYLENVTLTAVPNEGYHLDHWDNGSELATRSFVITCDTTFTFTFAPNVYVLSVLADNDAKGTVSGMGNYNYNTNVSIAAVANYGYNFNSWNDGNTENPRLVNIVTDSSFTALFDTVDFTVTAVSSNETMGTTSGSGSYPYLDFATLTATANYGYHFTQWSDGNTDNPRRVEVVANANYTAQFATDNFTLTVEGDALMGSATGAGSYAYGSNATLTATANYGYHFTQWNDGVTDNPRTVVVARDSSFTAQFAANTYNVAATSDNSTMGSVAGAGSYTYNTTATLTATANYGYHFAQWSDGVTTNPRSVVVTRDSNFTAQFATDNFTIAVNGDATMGSVAGAGSYSYNANAIISATANYGYHFTQWNDGVTDNPRTVVVARDSSFTAQFAANSYNVAAVSDNNVMGSVAGAGSYTYNTTATLTATANYGYHFAQWSDGVTTNPRSVVVTRDSNFTAQFATDNFTIAVNGDATMGSVAGAGSYSYNANAIISATANYGYHFTQWNDGVTDNPRTVVVARDSSFTAQFAANTYNVAATSANNIMGSVAGAGSYTYNTTATLTATANYGYHFTQWSDGVTTNPRSVVVTRDSNFVAQFEAGEFTITVNGDALMGAVTGSGSYNYNANAVIAATANYGYHFTQWSDGVTDNPRTVVVTRDSSFTAQFAENTYHVAANSTNVTMGSVTGTGDYIYNAPATLTATANYGYHFVAWTDGVTDNPRSVVVTRDSNFSAQFANDNFTITVNGDAVMGTAAGSGSYAYGESVMISANANYGYHFTQWNDGNTENPRMIVVEGNATYVAEFDNNEYQIVTVVESEAGSGSITGAGSYAYGDTVVLTATATPCYHFTQWSDGETSATRTVVVTGNMTFSTAFELNVYTSSFEQTVCDSYTWEGIAYTESTVETRVFQTVNGCDSTVTMTLTVNYSNVIHFDVVESGSYTWNDQVYTESGIYTQHFTNVYSCDSTVTINLTIYSFEAPEITDFNGTSLMVNHFPNGSSSYVDYADYRWYRNDQLVAQGTDTYVEGNNQPLNGCYYVEVPTNAAKTIWARSNTMCFRNGVGIEEAESQEVSFTVAPNPVRSGAMVTVKTELGIDRLQGAQLLVYDMNGRVMMQMPMEQQSVSFKAELVSGSYTVQLLMKDGKPIVKRLVIR